MASPPRRSRVIAATSPRGRLARPARSIAAARRSRATSKHWLADQFAREGKSDVGRAAAFHVAPLLPAAARARRRCARTPRCACARRSSPRRLPKTAVGEAGRGAARGTGSRDARSGLRDRAMLETLYATGLRVSELVGLKLAQVSLDAGVVRVIGKGSKERLVPLGDEAVDWIERYLAKARPELAGTAKRRSRVPDARGKGRSTRQAFWALIKRYALRAGIAAGGVVAARAAARVRDASAQSRRGSARRAAPARPRRHHDDDDLHARRARAAEAAARAASPARVTSELPIGPRTPTARVRRAKLAV